MHYVHFHHDKTSFKHLTFFFFLQKFSQDAFYPGLTFHSVSQNQWHRHTRIYSVKLTCDRANSRFKPRVCFHSSIWSCWDLFLINFVELSKISYLWATWSSIFAFYLLFYWKYYNLANKLKFYFTIQLWLSLCLLFKWVITWLQFIRQSNRLSW